MIALSLIAVVYIGLVALVQQDMKKLVAYSSVAHMGFVTLGFFIFNELGVTGGDVQMISHGFVSGAMFLCIGVLYDRVHSREIADLRRRGQHHAQVRRLCLAVLRDGQLRPAGHRGLRRRVDGHPGRRAVQLLDRPAGRHALIFGAAYTLWMYKRVYFGDVANDHVGEMTDINAREFLMLAVLAVAVLWMGVYPKPFTDVMHASVTSLLKHVAVSKLN
jgi:NADH-quinone oxidoreductase subunit M